MGGVGGCVSRVVGWVMMWAGGWARWLDGWDGGGLAGWQAGWATSNGQVAPAPIATRKANEFLLKELKKNARRNAPQNVIPIIVPKENKTTKCGAFPRTENGRKKIKMRL